MNWNEKRVMVTGSSGVIGRHLVRLLVANGAVVRGIDIAGDPSNLNSRRFEFAQKDILYLNPLDILNFAPEVVFHLAAAFERAEERVEFWRNNYFNNLLVNHKIIDAFTYCDSISKFIFASSYLVYDPDIYVSRRKPKKAVSLKESCQKKPRNLTGAAKYYAEQGIEFFHKNLKRKFQFTNARIFRVYGMGSKDVICRWVRSCLNGEELILYNKANSFDYIDSRDVAEALLKLAGAGYTGAVNVGTGISTPISKIAGILTRAFKKAKINDRGTMIDFENTRADIKLLKDLTAWSPSIDVETGIKNIIEYEKRQKARP